MQTGLHPFLLGISFSSRIYYPNTVNTVDFLMEVIWLAIF